MDGKNPTLIGVNMCTGSLKVLALESIMTLQLQCQWFERRFPEGPEHAESGLVTAPADFFGFSQFVPEASCLSDPYTCGAHLVKGALST